jgi:hypothetical protein
MKITIEKLKKYYHSRWRRGMKTTTIDNVVVEGGELYAKG